MTNPNKKSKSQGRFNLGDIQRREKFQVTRFTENQLNMYLPDHGTSQQKRDIHPMLHYDAGPTWLGSCLVFAGIS